MENKPEGGALRALIFDLDGTLCDTMPDIHASVCRMLDRLHYPPRDFAHTVGGLNRGSRYLIRHALPEGASDAEVDAALDCYMALYSEHLCELTRPYDGVAETLAQLRARGIKLAVLSNKPHQLVRRLIAQLFPDTFDYVVGQGEFPVKPSPDAVFAIAEELRVEPRQLALVGDSDVDAATAKNASARCIGVTWGYRSRDVLLGAGVDFLVDSPHQIVEIADCARQRMR